MVQVSVFSDELLGNSSCLKNRVGTVQTSVEETMKVERMNELTGYDVAHSDTIRSVYEEENEKYTTACRLS